MPSLKASSVMVNGGAILTHSPLGPTFDLPEIHLIPLHFPLSDGLLNALCLFARNPQLATHNLPGLIGLIGVG
jgi:hypothetical protein